MNETITPPPQSKRTLVWAIDPFEGGAQPDPALIKNLVNWATTADFELQPVYILSVPPGASVEYLEGTGFSNSINKAKEVMGVYLQKLRIAGLRPAQVIVAGSASRKKEVEALLDFAETLSSPCIVVSSHGRSGMQRFTMGSFAETLLQLSTRPVFFLAHLGAEHAAESPFKRVLFSTDFSEYSREAFFHFLREARQSHFELILFHSVSLPAAALGSGYEAPLVLPSTFFSDQTQWASEEGGRWVKLAESRGIPTRLVIKNDGINPMVGNSILETAKQEKAALVTMASTSGAVSSLIIGSVARDVFRNSGVPVWVYGPRALEKKLGVHPNHFARA